MAKNKKSIEENIESYTNYFKDDMAAIEEELKKSIEYSEIIDNQINALTEGSGAFGVNKGGQHYLIEHITNAVSLQTQRQNLRKDRFAIKKAILDYASKFADEDENGNEADILKAVEKLMNTKIKPQETETTQSENLDAEIDNLLEDKE